MKARKKILIRVDGHKRIGMGHIYRMLTLANYLRKKNCFTFVFVARGCAASLVLIKKSGFPVEALPFGISRGSEIDNLADILRCHRPSMVISDVLRSDRDENFMGALGYNKGVILVSFNDDTKRRLVDADIIFSSDLSQRADLYGNTQGAKYYLGFDYLILNEAYMRINKRRRKINKCVKRVVVCMGGADQHNLTAKILRAIDKSSLNFKCEVIVNSNFFDKTLAQQLSDSLAHAVSFNFDVDSLAASFARADLAITSGGLVHLERMCAGVPGIAINQHCRQADLSARIMRQGATLDLGLHNRVSLGKIFYSFNDLSQDYPLRVKMAVKGKELVDGEGLLRIAKIINHALGGK
ncbi:MAG: hypothetical protein COV72_02215 [Candidatus Omnitrophica bacterium CG11_big_fil_rev_8_21_14_0_20_42_13]|uniref:UDP-2,4-diacetamido-2,4, 6-trideoxy-beta-L-altropyranose hydrolase n=1 Tax=Candidatus Ghiorseimicrobium undicola TaxID=1974746 RepID=A0A2H0LZ36_9BACT|nr:MAG: hypothetical protein COV72_02215 [Candidatus Omnitrophica bacterium CG11_big_fil_rev_8_21_14_0_20_42_13]